MQYTEIMVRYGELSTKGKNRKDFIYRLGMNVRSVLKDLPEVEVKAQRDRLHVQLNGADANEVMNRLSLVFGIENFSPSIRIEKNMTDIKQTVLEMIKQQYQPGMSFKINTRRQDKDFEFDTNQINLQLGDHVIDNIPGIKVSMKQPDISVRVEIRMNGAYISSETIKGAGGLPVGTGGHATMMLSGGIDSPVASYLGMKRGR